MTVKMMPRFHEGINRQIGIITAALPFAMMAFYPAAFLLRGDEYRFYGLLAPVVGFLFLAMALSFWQLALRHYQSTGS